MHTLHFARPVRRLLGTALLAALCAVSSAALAEAERYKIDPNHLSIGFLVDHAGFAKTLGMFRTASGSFQFDEAQVALSDVRIEVDTASVFTNQTQRDVHLKGKDFLNSEAHPRMIFTATSATRTGDRSFDIKGQLELLGKTQPLTLQATWNKSASSPFGGFLSKPYLMGVSARGSFKRSAYGMNYGVANGWVGDDVALIIEFEAVRQ